MRKSSRWHANTIARCGSMRTSTPTAPALRPASRRCRRTSTRSARSPSGAKHKVVVFEYNANNHDMRRALGNALATNRIERDGRLPIVTSANGLQPDKQNDNGWDQGLLFLNPSKVWLQPPGYVTQMLSRDYLPQLVKCEVTDAKGELDATAKRSEDGATLVLQVVNVGDRPIATTIQIAGFSAGDSVAQVTELSGRLDAVNSADNPDAIVPRQSQWKCEMKEGKTSRIFPAHSFTIIRWRKSGWRSLRRVNRCVGRGKFNDTTLR